MNPISSALAGRLIDFTGTAGQRNESRQERPGDISPTLAESQLKGAVAAYNMLARNQVAYIADEVGLGKTYVALGVMGLVRHFRPKARILVLAPKENIQKKWVRDFGNFVRNNWRVVDNRVKSVQGDPARGEPVVCNSLGDFARELSINTERDFFLRMTSFSLALKHAEARDRYRRKLLEHVDWLRPELRAREPAEFREQYGRALNALLPDIDLLVVDEAHNLRKGFGRPGDRYTSNRNRVLGLMLGHGQAMGDGRPWYLPRVKSVLCLSATPFEDNYGDLWRQFDVLSKGSVLVRDPRGERVLPVKTLSSTEADEETRRLTANLLIRRITHLRIGGQDHTKNMYRREWRHGGFERPDVPIRFSDPRQRLIVALVQKKVAEVLGDEKFGNHFQIGMLSSFESFLQSVRNASQHQQSEDDSTDEAEETDEEGPTFDGQQTNDREEQRGADTRVLNALIESYRERFGREIPHPKLDATVESLAHAFETGDKALIFVRRVATVAELARRLDRKFDEWIERRMKDALPELHGEIDGLFRRFRSENRAGEEAPQAPGEPRPGPGQADDDEAELGAVLQPGVDDDPGGRENFFSWFFRGRGPDGVLSGAAFQKNRLSNVSAVYSTLFEDDLVSWLLGRPNGPLKELASRLGLAAAELEDELRQLAWAYYRQTRAGRAGRYPRYYVFEAYQAAGLHLMAEKRCGDLARKASDVLNARFPDHHGERRDPPDGFPSPRSAIGVTTFFTELVRKGCLRRELWPRPKGEEAGFAESFRRREQRRELLSTMSRLGGAYIDLYLLAIRQLGSFEHGSQAAGDHESGQSLGSSFVDLLAEQRQRPGCFHAFAELKGAADAFDTLIKVNFPEAPTAELSKLAELFGRSLQKQNPVGRMAGKVAGRTVRQFRMPGFPLVLISTDVLQEGEDLHTFCRRVIHYGITWTPSAMEQRTGRVDRIGGLAQRTLDGKCCPAEPHEKIQVLYPHLEDTVERLQVRRVLQRLDRFLQLVHAKPMKQADHDPRIDTNREVLAAADIPPPVEGKLSSAFPVRDEWLSGATDRTLVHQVHVDELADLLEGQWNRLLEDEGIEQSGQNGPLARHGVLRVQAHRVVPGSETGTRATLTDRGVRLQRVHLELRSGGGIADTTFLRCSSEIGHLNRKHGPVDFAQLRRLQFRLGMPRLCLRRDARHDNFALSIEASLPFDRTTTQYEEVRDLVRRVALHADRIEETLLGEDKDAETPEGANANGRSLVNPERAQAPKRVEQSTARRPRGLERVRELLGRQAAITWDEEGADIVVDMTCSDSDHRRLDTSRPTTARKQRVRVSRKGSEYVFATIVRKETSGDHDMALKAWQRNAETELVNFALDPKEQLVGEIRHPVGHLDEGEVLVYLQALATEGDRFEYVLSGRDEH